jgi:hypothetical protein
MPLALLAHVLFMGRIVIGAFSLPCRHWNGDRRQSHLPAHRHKRSTFAANPGARDHRHVHMDAKSQYVGGSLALLGIAIGFALDWVILLLVMSLPLVHYGIVLREERYLERKFGDEYRATRRTSHGIGGDSEIGSHDIYEQLVRELR